MDHQDEVDAVVAGLLRPLLDQDLSVVFYDLTTIRGEGLVTVEKDVRKFGQSKEGLIGVVILEFHDASDVFGYSPFAAS